MRPQSVQWDLCGCAEVGFPSPLHSTIFLPSFSETVELAPGVCLLLEAFFLSMPTTLPHHSAPHPPKPPAPSYRSEAGLAQGLRTVPCPTASLPVRTPPQPSGRHLLVPGALPFTGLRHWSCACECGDKTQHGQSP